MERFSTTALLAKLGFSCMLRGTWRNRAALPDNIWRRSRTAVSPSSPTLPGEVSHDAPCAKATFRVHVALGTCSPRHHEVRRQPRVAGFEAYLCRTMRCTLKLTGASHWGRLAAPHALPKFRRAMVQVVTRLAVCQACLEVSCAQLTNENKKAGAAARAASAAARAAASAARARASASAIATATTTATAPAPAPKPPRFKIHQ